MCYLNFLIDQGFETFISILSSTMRHRLAEALVPNWVQGTAPGWALPQTLGWALVPSANLVDPSFSRAANDDTNDTSAKRFANDSVRDDDSP